MLKIEEFSDAKRHPINTFEWRMARAYREAVNDLKSARCDFGNPLPQIDDAEKMVAEIESDIENFMDIVGSYSRHNIAHRLNRAKLDIANAKRKARNIKKKAIQENPGLSPDNVDKLDIVQAAFTERDSIIADLKPVVAELKRTIMNAEEILVKYG
jgi:hypothetical protein